MKRYQILADDIEASIRAGVLQPGDKLPSVRHSCESRGVSASTVFQAYYLLEARGLVRARERSGYFVCDSAAPLPAQPQQPSQPQDASIAVDVSALVFEVLQASTTREVVALGSAFPSPLLFPLARLGQAIATAAQTLDPWSTVDDLSQGNQDLRRQIALRYLADGLQVAAEDIVITHGALEALNLCLGAVTRPGDAVVVEAPTFYAALQALERLGLHAIEVPTHPSEGIDLAALEHAINRHGPTACWLMTTFQNPLGSLMPEAKKRDLVALLARYQLPLIEDDVYAELYFGDKRPLPAKAFDPQGLVLHCGSFSKCLAPGYRLGWAAPGRFTQAVARHKLTTTLGVAHTGATGLERLPAPGRLRQAPAPPAPNPGSPQGTHARSHCPPLSPRHPRHPARRRLLCLGRATRRLRHPGPAPPGTAARHQHCARADFFGLAQLCPLFAAQLRARVARPHRTSRRHPGATGLGAGAGWNLVRSFRRQLLLVRQRPACHSGSPAPLRP